MVHDLYTPQGEALTGTPWQIYPRPQLKRDSYVNLNGLWDFTVTEKETPEAFDQKILVPFCPESLLSGIHQHFPEGSSLWYHRKFSLPEDFHTGRVLLHVGAADQITEIYVNQKHIGSHTGGYHSFSFDITHRLQEENTLLIRVTDDLRNTVLPYGKQTLHRGGMWYTPVSGIWQTVWLERVPEAYVEDLTITTTLTEAVITVIPAFNGTIFCQGKTYPLIAGKAVIAPENPHLWSPEDPYLYSFTIEAGEDRVQSYFALRTLETKVIRNIPRLCLNGRPYFFHGLLDQGYFSDGIYTPASPDCYQKDIETMKALGFNTLRKHIKIEPEAFYYLCDKLGMIVFQDMVNNGFYSFLRDTALPTIGLQKLPDKALHKDPATRKAFLTAMEETVHQLKNHPCICYWTIFNEGWGQFDSDKVYPVLKKLDGSRFIDSASGWFRREKTDVDSRHIYFGSWKTLKPGTKPLVLSEFGGHCWAAEGHLFNPDKAYGYKSCKTQKAFQESPENLYRTKVIPGVKKGLCGAIYTQVSDVEDEINGLLTYDRRVLKADPKAMTAMAKALQKAFAESL